MNNFNRILYTYINYRIGKKKYIIKIKCKKLNIEKKGVYLQYRKKPIKITIMDEKADINKKENYRVTIILKNEIITVKFYKQGSAMETVESMRKLFPDLFVAGAIEERSNKWKVIWTLGPVIKN